LPGLSVSANDRRHERDGGAVPIRRAASRPDGSQVGTLTGVGGLLDLSARRLVPDPRERFRALATDPGPLNL
jgi:acyl-CoA thioester hydrolase